MIRVSMSLDLLMSFSKVNILKRDGEGWRGKGSGEGGGRRNRRG
jgi:hypothetical protein